MLSTKTSMQRYSFLSCFRAGVIFCWLYEHYYTVKNNVNRSILNGFVFERRSSTISFRNSPLSLIYTQ